MARPRPMRPLALGTMIATLLVGLATPRSALAEAFPKGPYLLDPTPTSIVIGVELASPESAHITIRGPEDERTYDTDAVTHLRWRESGLTPDTEYHYRISAGEMSASGTFRTPRDHDRDDAHICLYGDSRSGEAIHRRVLAALARPSEGRVAPEAVLHLGDFVAAGGKPEQWEEPFESIRDVGGRLGFLPVLGNHELHPDDTGRPLYQRYFGRAMGDAPYYVRRFGPLVLVVIDTNSDWDESDPQVDWLDEQLRSLRQEHPDAFIVVAAHHPLYSSSLHRDRERLQRASETTLREHADLFVAGHDHTYERGSVSGLHYLVSGGGGSPLYPLNHRRAGQLAYAPEHHFVCMDISGGQLGITAIRPDGTEIERCFFERGSPWVCTDGTPDGPIGGISPIRYWLSSAYLWRRLGPVIGLLLLILIAARIRARRRRRPRSA